MGGWLMTVGAARPLFAVATELLWSFAAVAVAVQVVAHDDGSAPSLLIVALVGGGGFALARLLRASDLDDTGLAVAGVAATALALGAAWALTYETAPWSSAHALAAMVALLAVWVRGVQRGQREELEPDGVLNSVSAGFVPVVVAALARPPVMGGMAWSELLVAYAVVALVTLALFRAPDPEAQVWSAAGAAAPGIAAVVVAAAAITIAAAAVDPGSFGALAGAAEPLRTAGAFVAKHVLAPVFGVLLLPVQLLFEFIAWLLPDPSDRTPPEETPVPTPEPEPSDARAPGWLRLASLIVAAVVATIGVTAVASLAVLWLASLFRRFARRAGAGRARDTSTPVEPLPLDGGAGALLGAIGRRLRRSGARRGAVPVERLYFELLDDAARRGLQRPPAATPLEFAPTLDAHFATDAPSRISAAFSESRYGARDVDDGRMRQLAALWHALLRRDEPP